MTADTDGRVGHTMTRSEVGGRDLGIAIGVGVLLAALFLGSLFWSPLAFSILVAGLVTYGLFEATGVLAAEGIPVARWPALAGGLAMLAGAYLAGGDGQIAGMAVLFGAIVADAFASAERRHLLQRMGTTLFLGVWVGFLGSFAVRLAVTSDEPATAVLAVVGAAIFTDIGGFFVGVRFGSHKIAPSISPAKSWEGLLGGLALSAVLAALVLPALGERFTVPEAIAVAVLSGLGGFFGDLLESLVKRVIGVKDLGDVLPGHGGILDRVDGIVLALPLGYYILALVS